MLLFLFLYYFFDCEQGLPYKRIHRLQLSSLVSISTSSRTPVKTVLEKEAAAPSRRKLLPAEASAVVGTH